MSAVFINGISFVHNLLPTIDADQFTIFGDYINGIARFNESFLI